MKWIEAELYTATEAIEACCGMLMEAGIYGVQIEDDADMKSFLETNSEQWDYVDEELLAKENGETKIKFYLSDNVHGMEDLSAVRLGIERMKATALDFDLGRLELKLANVDDQDWLNNWKKYYKPFAVGSRVVIRPEWEEYDNIAGKVVFTINPGHVFGTGLHQTTQLCIEQLEEHVTPETEVLDLGCGSGILSIISLLLGAKHGLAVDIDPNAQAIAYENANLNGITGNYEVLYGNVLTDEGLRARIFEGKYQVVLANIVADVVIGLSELVPMCLADGGVFIASGIISQRVEDVEQALEANGLQICSRHIKDDWHCIVSTLKE